MYLHTHRRKYVLDSTPRVIDINYKGYAYWMDWKCMRIANNIWHVTSSFRLTMSVFTLREQLRRYQFLVHSLTRNEFFAVHVVRVPLHT